MSQEELIVDEQLPADELLEDYNQHSQDVDLRARIQRIENIIQESPHKVKREEKLKDIPKEMPSSNFSVSIYEPIKRNRLDQPEDPEDEEFESIMKKYFSLKKTKTEEEDDKKSEESDDLDFMVKPKEPEFKPFDSDFKLFSLKKDSKELSDPKTQSKKKRNYKPDTNSSGCFILLGLKFYEEETGKKYALKKDIKDQLKKSADFLGPMEVKSWNAIDTLTKNELVVPFKFNDEMKYSLSLAGKELADELCLEKLAEKKSGASTKTSNESSNSLPESNAESDVVFIDKTNLPIKTPKIAKSTSFESETQQVSFSSQPNKPFRYYSQESAPIKGTSELQKKDNLFEIPEDDYYSQSQTQGFMSQSLSRREKLLENYEQKASVEGHYAHKIMKSIP